MLINATLLLFAPLVSQWHAQAMVLAVIIELLIITISLRGERDYSGSVRRFGGSLRNTGGSVLARNRGGALA